MTPISKPNGLEGIIPFSLKPTTQRALTIFVVKFLENKCLFFVT